MNDRDSHSTTVDPDGSPSCTCGWQGPSSMSGEAHLLAQWHRLSISATLDNPLLTEFLAPITAAELAESFSGGSAWLAHHRRRERLCAIYAWAIPTEHVIRQLAALSPICDLGCGTGYWASLIAKAGGEVLAIDAKPPLDGDNAWHHTNAQRPVTIRHFTEVIAGDAETFEVPPSHALLLGWPPYDSPMAATALARYRGEHVIYVGEPDGCTADDTFHAALADQWRVCAHYEIPQWPGIHDEVRVYARK